jgi:hypothetical protein
VRLDARALDSLDEVAAMLAEPATSPASLVTRLRALQDKPQAPAREPQPIAAPAPERMEATQPAPIEAAPTEERATPAMTPTRASTVAPPSPLPQERDRPAAAEVAHLASAATVAKPELGSLLDVGIAKLGALQSVPLATPVSVPEQPAVPIEVLVYRGRAAIERCREIRDQVRSAGGPVDADTLGELFDLLDLALTD